MFTSAANAADIDLSDDGNSNVGGDRSDDNSEDIKNHRDNDEEELEPYILENLLWDNSDYELTEKNTGSDGELAQLIKTKQEERKYVWMAKEKA